jgi:MFS family permease
MRDWFGFIFSNKRILNFGFLFNFFSSFGQTFFISLFVPFWVQSLAISNASFGSIYAFITIIAAFLLSITGKYIDRLTVRNFSLYVFSGLIISIIILSQAYTIYILIFGLLFVRFFGQGLMTHTSSTGIAKYFDKNRGKALGFTALGHPAGQFLFPLILVPLISLYGWQNSLLVLAGLSLIILLPAIYAINKISANFYEQQILHHNTKTIVKSKYLLSLKFWIIAFNIFIIPFICTAVFLYQFQIGERMGWTVAWITFSFSFYAITNALSLLFSGYLIDKYSGVILFPLYLLPALASLLLFVVVKQDWVLPVFYGGLGISTGLGSTIKTALQTEIYGVKNLGRIRSYFSTILVLSTALGPPFFGYFIDHSISFNYLMLLLSFFLVLSIFLSFRYVK